MATRAPFFLTPFALSGDVAPIPNAAPVDGSVSFETGFGPDYQADQETDPNAKPVPRDQTNWLYNAITQNLRFWQTEAFPEWISAADNGGVAFAYEVGTVVRYRATGGDPFVTYINTAPNNTNAPPNAGWVEFSGLANNALLNVRAFTSSGTYTPTPGTKSIRVRVQGAGGAGGGSPATGPTTIGVGIGGGSGAYAEGFFTTGFTGVSMTIGNGGAGVLGSAGGAGGTSSFGALMSAGGGTGGNLAGPTFPPLTIGNGNAATATGGYLRVQGNHPGPAFVIDGSVGLAGIGANSLFGNGGTTANNAGPGDNARGYGAGGGGCISLFSQAASTGGSGAPGIIIVEEFA